jgi:hypothetical protein
MMLRCEELAARLIDREVTDGAVLGALRGRYLNVLVTDDAAARAVLTRAGEGGHTGNK